MGKNSDNEIIDRFTKSLDKQANEVKNGLSNFYEDGVLVGLSSSPDKDPFVQIFSTLRKNSIPQPLKEEEMLEKCTQIRNNVKQGKPDSIEINFSHMVHRFFGNIHELNSTVIKAIAMDAAAPIYLYIKKGDSLNSLVFLGGDEALGFLVTKDDDGADRIIRLSEFHLLSISENSTPEKEIGLMTSYSWITAKVHSSIIIGMNLDPIKNLLLSEGLRTITAEGPKHDEIVEGEEADGQELEETDNEATRKGQVTG